MTLLFAALPLLVCQASDDPAADPMQGAWTRFRGPEGTSVLPTRRYPAEWGPEKNLAWSVDVPGSGWSSPVVVDGRILVTSASSESGGGR